MKGFNFKSLWGTKKGKKSTPLGGKAYITGFQSGGKADKTFRKAFKNN